MPEAWDFYLTDVGGVCRSYYLNLLAHSATDCAKYPMLLFFGLELLQKRENGMTTNEEAETMYAIEDAMIDASRPLQAKYVARMTGGGRRVFFFYVSVDAIEATVAAILNTMKSFPQYQLEIQASSDPQWQYFLTKILPSARDSQAMQDRHVLLSLQKHGDSLQIPRFINHWVYFPDTVKRQAFVDQAETRGFHPKSLHDKSLHDVDKDGLRFCVILERKDSVQADEISAVTLELFDLARSYGGDYDGWECKVIKTPKDAEEY